MTTFHSVRPANIAGLTLGDNGHLHTAIRNNCDELILRVGQRHWPEPDCDSYRHARGYVSRVFSRVLHSEDGELLNLERSQFDSLDVLGDVDQSNLGLINVVGLVVGEQ